MSETVKGDTGLRDALGHLKRARVRITVQATEIVEDNAKGEAPVLTGALRADIDHKIGAGSTSGEVTSGNALDYPVFVHGGTRFITANPYMDRALRRAVAQVEHEAVAILKQELGL